MNQSDLMVWLFGELRHVLAETDNTGISIASDAEDHVDIADADIDHKYPFIGVQQIAQNPQSQGIGAGTVSVAKLRTDDNDVLTEIVYQKDVDVRVSLVPVTDNDPSLRDTLIDEIVNHFSVLARKDGYPDDVSFELVGEATPQGRPDERVRATGVPLALSYERTIVDDDPDVADTVNIDVDVTDETDTTTDAFDEQF